MSRRHGPFPALTLGEPELGAWCAPCQLPTRLRVPVLLDDPPLYTPIARLEVCPGCGSTYSVPNAELMPAAPSAVLVTREPRRSPRLIVTRWLYERACRRAGTVPLECAYGDCRYPGYRTGEVAVNEDDGTCRYYFCGRKHLRTWLAENWPTALTR